MDSSERSERRASLRIALNAELTMTGLFGFYDLYEYEQRDLLRLTEEGLEDGKTVGEIVIEWRNS